MPERHYLPWPAFEACLRPGAGKRVGDWHGVAGFPRANDSSTGKRSAVSVGECFNTGNITGPLWGRQRREEGKGQRPMQSNQHTETDQTIRPAARLIFCVSNDSLKTSHLVTILTTKHAQHDPRNLKVLSTWLTARDLNPKETSTVSSQTLPRWNRFLIWCNVNSPEWQHQMWKNRHALNKCEH